MTALGSLFSGYAGLDMAVEAVTGGHTVWHSDIDPGACKILAHHWPDTPNLGDISAVDWSRVQPVDIITGGFPCQDVSMAGRRAGLGAGTRSGLWAMMADAINHLRPSLVVIENVRGLLSAAADSDVEPCPWCVGDVSGEPPLRALGAVLGDLADIGYDAAWHGLTAASVGAPHGRFRVFIVAWPQSADTGCQLRSEVRGLLGETEAGSNQPSRHRAPVTSADANRLGYERGGGARGWRYGSADDGHDAAHTDGPGLAQWAGVTGDDEPQRASAQRGHRDGCAAADTACNGWHEGWPEPTGVVWGHDAAECGDAVADADCCGFESREQDLQARQSDITGSGTINWGQFEPAIRRWERLTRPAPAPTETSTRGGQRLSPQFVEWMMGLPKGHVTNVPGLSRNEQLKALGNGVVPQQAATALRVLLNAMAAS